MFSYFLQEYFSLAVSNPSLIEQDYLTDPSTSPKGTVVDLLERRLLISMGFAQGLSCVGTRACT